MRPRVYYHGIPGAKWGIWNDITQAFELGISEDTPMLAEARLHQKIGDQARMKKYLTKQLPREAIEIQGRAAGKTIRQKERFANA